MDLLTISFLSCAHYLLITTSPTTSPKTPSHNFPHNFTHNFTHNFPHNLPKFNYALSKNR